MTCVCMITPEKKKGKYIYYHCTQYRGKHENAKWVTEDDLTSQFKQYFSGFEMSQEAVDDITQSI